MGTMSDSICISLRIFLPTLLLAHFVICGKNPAKRLHIIIKSNFANFTNFTNYETNPFTQTFSKAHTLRKSKKNN